MQYREFLAKHVTTQGLKRTAEECLVDLTACLRGAVRPHLSRLAQSIERALDASCTRAEAGQQLVQAREGLQRVSQELSSARKLLQALRREGLVSAAHVQHAGEAQLAAEHCAQALQRLLVALQVIATHQDDVDKEGAPFVRTMMAFQAGLQPRQRDAERIIRAALSAHADERFERWRSAARKQLRQAATGAMLEAAGGPASSSVSLDMAWGQPTAWAVDHSHAEGDPCV